MCEWGSHHKGSTDRQRRRSNSADGATYVVFFNLEIFILYFYVSQMRIITKCKCTPLNHAIAFRSRCRFHSCSTIFKNLQKCFVVVLVRDASPIHSDSTWPNPMLSAKIGKNKFTPIERSNLCFFVNQTLVCCFCGMLTS